MIFPGAAVPGSGAASRRSAHVATQCTGQSIPHLPKPCTAFGVRGHVRALRRGGDMSPAVAMRPGRSSAWDEQSCARRLRGPGRSGLGGTPMQSGVVPPHSTRLPCGRTPAVLGVRGLKLRLTRKSGKPGCIASDHDGKARSWPKWRDILRQVPLFINVRSCLDLA